jgi:hypothetical protein
MTDFVNGKMVVNTPILVQGDLDLDCGSQKTLNLINTVWDDIIILPNNMRGGTTPPSWATVFKDGVYQMCFVNGQSDEVYGSFELPHDYKEGTALYPHLHWSPSSTDTGNCVFTVVYSIAIVNGVFGTTSTALSFTQAGAGVALTNQLIDSSAVIAGTGRKIGDIIVFRLARPTGDAFTGDAFLHSFGVHYEIDTMGSRQRLVK